MSRARNLADLLDASGDVKSGSLDNVPASDDASALTTGTLPVDRVPYIGRRNLIINGAMQVAQRGTVSSITGPSYGGPDRFQINFGGGPTNFTLEQSSDAPANTAFKNSMRVTVGTGDALGTASSFALIRTMFEGQDLHRFKKGTTDAQQFTLQFWARSAVTGTHIVRLRDNDNSRNVSASYSIASANTWEYQQITFPADATGVFDDDNGRSLIIQWFLGAGSNYSSGTLSEVWASGSNADVNAAAGQVNAVATNGNIFGITGVQLEVGTVATPFEHRSYGEELALCQRYYYRASGGTIIGAYIDSNRIDATIHFPTTMRAIPDMTASSGTNYWYAYTGGSPDYFNAWSGAGGSSVNNGSMYVSSGEISGPDNAGCQISFSTGDSYFQANAEL